MNEKKKKRKRKTIGMSHDGFVAGM